MAHSLSAKKRVRQNERRRERNRIIKSRIRTARRAFQQAVDAESVETARGCLLTCRKLMQRAAMNGPLARGQVARTIGRMQTCLNGLAKAGAAQ